MFKKLFSLFAALTLCAGLWADGSVITYTATEKLEYNFSRLGTVATHEFNDGNGKVTYNETVTTIINSAFSSCTSLSSITLPEGVTTIGERAFYNCESLTSATLPEGLTTIGVYAFYGCGFTSITLPKGVTTIELYAFQECKSLQSITLPEGLTTIGQQAFYKTVLTSVTIPASVTTVGQWAFYGCTALASVTFLGNACQDAIGKNAFYDVGETTPATLVLPNNWTGSKPVDNQTKWYGGYFTLAAPAKTSVITYTAEEKLKETTSMYGDGLHTNAFYAADSTLLTITEHSFSEGTGTITLDGEVAIFGNYAFRGSALTSIEIPNTVTHLGKSSFMYLYKLTSLTLPDGLVEIGESAFYDDSLLVSLTIPASVTTIGENALWGCYNLASLVVEEGNTQYDSRDNCNAVIETATNTLLFGSGYSTIPGTVTAIAPSAIRRSPSLTSLVIPASVTSIGEYAFYWCENLASVTFEGNACQEGIASNAFGLVGETTPATLVLPDNWTGSVPVDNKTPWYGGYFNYEAPATTTFNVTVPAGTDACYLVGSMNSWSIDAPIAMTKVDDTHYTYTAESDLTNAEYKYVHGATWDKVEKAADGSELGNRVVNAEVMNDTVERWADAPTGWVNVNVNADVNKYLYNGQVIIRKGNKTYNTLGAEL